MLKTRTGQFPIGFRRSFPEWHKDLSALIQWAKENNFYVIDLGKDGATAVRQMTEAGLHIGSIDLPDWQGLISKDPKNRAEAVSRAVSYIEDCCEVTAPLNFFVVMLPEDPSLPREENFKYMVESYTELTPILEKYDSAIAIEGWPGPGALCCTPETVRAFFDMCPSRAMGFNYDPSHLIRMGIDPLRFLREFGDRVRHVHGKDTEILTEELYEYGNTQPRTFGKGAIFGGANWRYTIPGHGAMRWGEAFKILKAFGYSGAVSIELEDDNFLSGDEASRKGILTAAQYLEGC